MTLLYILFFTILTGICEAAYFHIRYKSHIKFKNEHWYLVALRAPVFFMSIEAIGIWPAIFAWLCFPFIHDGVYYQFRHWIEPELYGYGFLDDSTGSTAWWEITLPWRILGAVGGGLGLAVHYGG